MGKDDIVFSLRVKTELKRALERLAAADQRSLNNYIVRVLDQHVAPQTKRGAK